MKLLNLFYLLFVCILLFNNSCTDDDGQKVNVKSEGVITQKNSVNYYPDSANEVVMIYDFDPENLQGKKLTVMLSDAGRNVGQILTVSDEPLARSPWSKLVDFVRGLLAGNGSES